MEITPISKQSISEQVYEQLKNNLIDGTWKPGDKIPSENELSEAFGTSRVTVRQALSKLAALGLIETRLGEGSFVCEVKPAMHMKEMMPYLYLSEDSVREVLHFRRLTEPGYAADAAEKLTKDDISRLKKTLHDMERYRDDIEKYVDSDIEFHMLIARATGNTLVIQLNSIIQDLLKSNIKMISDRIGVENGLRYHQQLIEAFEKKDSGNARILMARHLEEASDKID